MPARAFLPKPILLLACVFYLALATPARAQEAVGGKADRGIQQEAIRDPSAIAQRATAEAEGYQKKTPASAPAPHLITTKEPNCRVITTRLLLRASGINLAQGCFSFEIVHGAAPPVSATPSPPRENLHHNADDRVDRP